MPKVTSLRQEIFDYMDRYPYTRPCDLCTIFPNAKPNSVKTYKFQWDKKRKDEETNPTYHETSTIQTTSSTSAEGKIILPDDDPIEAVFSTCMRCMNSDDDNVKLKAASLMVSLMDKSGKLDVETKREKEVDTQLSRMPVEQVLKIITGKEQLPPMKPVDSLPESVFEEDS